MSKGLNQTQGLGRLAMAVSSFGFSEVARVATAEIPDMTGPTGPTSIATGMTAKTGSGKTLEGDSTRATRRKKVSQGNKQFRVPLASQGVNSSGGIGTNTGSI